MNQQLTIFDAIERGNRGMTLAAEKADREYEGWTTLAYAFLKRFIAERKQFWPWELVDASVEYGLAQPTNLRAWGGIYQRAAKAGLIVQGTELAKHPKRHGTKVPVWLVVKAIREAA